MRLKAHGYTLSHVVAPTGTSDTHVSLFIHLILLNFGSFNTFFDSDRRIQTRPPAQSMSHHRSAISSPVRTRHYDEQALAALVIAIATINSWNRLNVVTRQVAGTAFG